MRITKANAKQDSTTELDAAIREYRDSRNAASEATSRENLAKSRVLDLLKEGELKTGVARDGGKKFTATIVTPEDSAVLDEAGLLLDLTDEERAEVTETIVSLSKPLLEAAMDTRGQDFTDRVARHVTMKPRAPYLRFTEGVNDDFKPE